MSSAAEEQNSTSNQEETGAQPSKTGRGSRRGQPSRGSGSGRSASSAGGSRRATSGRGRSASDRQARGDQAAEPAGPKLRPRLQRRFTEEIAAQLKREFGYENPMEIPRPRKIVINVGLGEALENSNALQAAINDIAQITGQRPVATRARKSIAGFRRLRAGQAIGVKVTLRDVRMWQFLDRLINVALPRVRDFHGVSRNSFDGRGNYALGLREQVIFPEIDYNRIDRLRGLQVNIATAAKTDEEARRLLELLGMPFTRQERVAAA